MTEPNIQSGPRNVTTPPLPDGEQAAKAPAAPPKVARACLSQPQELDVLIRSRYPIIYIESWEEERVEKCLLKIAKARHKDFFTWTITEGIVRADVESTQVAHKSSKTTDPLAALDAVLEHVQSAIFLFKDFHRFTEENRSNLAVIRRLRDVAYHLRDSYKTIVIVAPATRIASDLSKDVTVFPFSLPNQADFSLLIDRIVDDVKDNPKVSVTLTPDERERILEAARGLTLKEAENVFAKTLVLNGRLSADDISLIFSEKQQIIRKNGLLEYYNTNETIKHVAGLDNLKSWLVKRKIAFTKKAHDFGLPAPKGLLLLGVQGCGKSLCAKAISALWEQPLLRFDLGRLFSGLVGSSEENVRAAIQVAESVAPAILWIDEIDKALGGSSQDAGGSDGGTSARVFGTLLTWLSEKTAPVFVIATANNISRLPPELLRKGRFDEIFFVDLPDLNERKGIFQVHLAKRRWRPADFDLDALARKADGFSGAEIEEVVVSALFDAFSENKKLSTEILLNAITQTVPLSRTMSEELGRLRNWASGRARMASHITLREVDETKRKIEF
ncbi:MAG: AAA family ATPase [Planctomycetia bacterium]|nr:AAA family ATPase [Planctomycetia bacterium]